jgi:ribonuclease P protein component
MRGRRARTIGRLTKRPEFLAAAAGRRFHTERLTLQGRLRDGPAGTEGFAGLRFGFTVTKKAGHAVERNRIKRRLRAAAQEAGARHADKPADVVVIGRRIALSAAYDLLVADIDRGLGVVTKPRGAAPKGAGRPPSPLSTGDSGREATHA